VLILANRTYHICVGFEVSVASAYLHSVWTTLRYVSTKRFRSRYFHTDVDIKRYVYVKLYIFLLLCNYV